MRFIFVLFDVLLTLIMLFDTLGLIYQFRKSTVDPKEYVRICASWILFLTICSLFSCSWNGFFGTLIGLLILAAKIYVTIPILGGANKIITYLLEEGRIENWVNKGATMIKSKLCKGDSCFSTPSSSQYPSETVEPERVDEGDTLNQ